MRESPSPRLLKHVVRCYLRLSDSDMARKQFMDPTNGSTLPIQIFVTPELLECLSDDKDPITRKWLVQFLVNIGQTQIANRILRDAPGGEGAGGGG